MQLAVTSAERDLLVRLLEAALGDTRVEVRRTTTPEFHDQLRDEEELIGNLLSRVRGL
jgi:hypothetical protein